MFVQRNVKLIVVSIVAVIISGFFSVIVDVGKNSIALAGTTTSTGAVPIVATVPSVASPPPPPPPPQPEPTPVNPLVISSVATSALSGSSVAVSWNTNKASDSKVEWGLTQNYELNNVSNVAQVTSHALRLTGLSPNTTYFARVTSKTGGETAIKDQISFTTPDSGFVPLAISATVINNSSPNTLIVSWDTNKIADARVQYGKTAQYELGSTSAPALTLKHSVNIGNLEPLTTYFVKIISKTAQETSEFSTSSKTNGLPPAISNALYTPIVESSGTLSWGVSEAVATKVGISTRAEGPFDTIVVSLANSTQQHAVTLTDLKGLTNYYYVITAIGQYGTTVSEVKTFITPDNTPPKITKLEVVSISATGAMLKVTTDEETTVKFDIKNVQKQLVGTKSSDPMGLDKIHILNISGLIPNASYDAKIFVEDSAQNSSIATITFSTSRDESSPPNVSDFNALILGQQGSNTTYQWRVDLTWNNPSVSDFSKTIVVYSYSAFPKNISDGVLVPTSDSKSATLNISNSKVGFVSKNIYFTAFATDTSENSSSGSAIMRPLTIPSSPLGQDQDNDVINDVDDNCPQNANQNQLDSDNDGIGDVCDETPKIPVTPPSDDGGGIPKEIPYKQPIGGNDQKDIDKQIDEKTNAKPVVNPSPLDALKDILGISVAPKIKQGLMIDDVAFTAAAHTISLTPIDGVVSVLAGFDVGVIVSKKNIPNDKKVNNISLVTGSSTYLLSETQNSWSTSFLKSNGFNPSLLKIAYEDGSEDTVPFSLNGVLYGLVSADSDGSLRPLTDASVALLDMNDQEVFVNSFGQKNPTRTTEEGLYGFMVPNGRYRLHITQSGFRDELSEPIDVINNVLNRNVTLLSIPKNLLDVINPKAPLAENVLNITENIQQKVVFQASIGVRESIKFAENPEVEEATEKTVAPTIATVAILNTTAATGISSLWTYAQFFFSQPLLLFQRRKRKSWGVVYNSLTKNPVDLAYVRLIDTSTGAVVRTKITDALGRYAFFVNEGSYKIEASKVNYVFPSVFMASEKMDGRYLDIYHSENISVASESLEITPNIPLDPIEADQKQIKKLMFSAFIRRVQLIFSVSGVVLAVISSIIIPSPRTFLVVFVQILLFFLMRRLVFPPKPKDWGIVYDAYDRTPLKFAIARIFDVEYNKLLDSQLTDSRGRYSFLASQRKYFVTYEKKGFQKVVSNEFDLTMKKEPTVIGEKVLLPRLVTV